MPANDKGKDAAGALAKIVKQIASENKGQVGDLEKLGKMIGDALKNGGDARQIKSALETIAKLSKLISTQDRMMADLHKMVEKSGGE